MFIKNSGFTLIELMIVIAIIGILAATAVPLVSNYLDKAKNAQITAVNREVNDRVKLFFLEKGEYPDGDPDNLKKLWEGGTVVGTSGETVYFDTYDTGGVTVTVTVIP